MRFVHSLFFVISLSISTSAISQIVHNKIDGASAGTRCEGYAVLINGGMVTTTDDNRFSRPNNNLVMLELGKNYYFESIAKSANNAEEEVAIVVAVTPKFTDTCAADGVEYPETDSFGQITVYLKLDSEPVTIDSGVEYFLHKPALVRIPAQGGFELLSKEQIIPSEPGLFEGLFQAVKSFFTDPTD